MARGGGGGAAAAAGGVKKPARAPTAFERRAYALLRCVPSGRVTTYGAMAAALGSSARAVGGAMRRNPYAPEVPCHRVVAATLEIGGFSGSWDVAGATVARKRALLAGEGVAFGAGGRLAAPAAAMAAEELAAAAEAAGVDLAKP
jgi:methylated-DNA-[protein]-cysteine S-methyltransferase